MKSAFIWLPLVFIIGGMVGYYGPAEELRSYQAQEKITHEKNQKKNRQHGFGSFTQLVNIPEVASRSRHKNRGEWKKKSSAKKNQIEEKKNTTTTNLEKVEQPARRHLNPEDLRVRIEEAADLWRSRSDIAHAAAVEKLNLDAQGKKAFDEVLKAMNNKLRSTFQIVAEEIATSKQMTPELGIRMMGDVATSLSESYDSLAANLGENMREEVSKLQMVDFIDPSVAEPLIEVQGIIENRND
jgi:hypothetical protein